MADKEFQPIRIDTSQPAVEADTSPLFYIDEEEYRVPNRISGATALKAMDVVVRGGEDAAALWLAQYAIGTKGIEDLFSCPQLTIEQAKALMDEIGRKYLAQAKELTKN